MQYTYQLRNAQGDPQANVTIFEHLKSLGDSAAFAPSRATTNSSGDFLDTVGPKQPLINGHYVVEQTFSVGSNSAPVLSTTFSHSILVTNNSVIINFGVLQP